jgi:hypothetical protein
MCKMYCLGFKINCLCVLFVGDSVKVGLKISFDNVQDWREMWGISREISSTTAYVTSDETCCEIVTGIQ